MAFKKTTSADTAPDSPDLLLRELPRRKIPDLLSHQAQILADYAAHTNKPDVALQLPTGSGKTLAGLMIAEWRRRKFNERVVYLCPTRQLVHQVASQAEEKYGLSVGTFVGQQKDYLPTAKTDFKQASKIAITTYSGLFNNNSFFDTADVILLDDAHAAENYIASHWSLRVERLKDEHASLHLALCVLFSRYLDPIDMTRVSGVWEHATDRNWVDMLPLPVLHEIKDELVEILDVHTYNNDLRWPWALLRSHLEACHIYLSSQDILIRPLLPPTYSHAPFENAHHRVYMSATLGAGGDLERLTGRKSIQRLAAPKGWDIQGVGRRFFIFPEMSLSENEAAQLRLELMKRAGRSVILVPSDAKAEIMQKEITDNIGFKTYSAEDIEKSKTLFVSDQKAVAIIANRYDGVDFAGNECRLLCIEGLPKGMNSQERFLMSRMGANTLFNERIQTRVVQAIGRCTRSLEDFSAVVVTGEELPDYISDLRRRKYLHPELQAEIWFGVEQSKETDIHNLVENFDIFLSNGKEWEDEGNKIILDKRAAFTQSPLPAIEDLTKAVSLEVEYQTSMWRANYTAAMEAAERVLGLLTSPELRGYRALWAYLAGAAAYLSAESGSAGMDQKSRQYFESAYKSAPNISWLAQFARRQTPQVVNATEDNTALLKQVERIGAELTRLGTTHDRAFTAKEKEILEGLSRPETFEQAQVELGKILGFVANKVESEGSPDPWWISGQDCVVFEDYVNTTKTSALDVTKARQASSHPDWMKANVSESTNCRFTPVLVTPAQSIRSAAVPHASDLKLWKYDEFQSFAVHAMRVIRTLRQSFFEQGDLIWQTQAADIIIEARLDMLSIIEDLNKRPVIGGLAET
jgi:hypothetical protein